MTRSLSALGWEADIAPDTGKLHAAAMEWSSIAQDFEPAGGLRDIYILNASLPVWEDVWSLLTADPDLLEFWVDGDRTDPPSDLQKIFERRPFHGFLATYRLGTIGLNCHFFGAGEVELDLDPREVRSAADGELLERFLTQIGRATSQEVILTPENQRDSAIARYDPAADRVIWSSAR
ncbi:hypothetical protein [Sphingopyxis microcysteis]|uniref:hypothetical protein n=1 Tax=Sphingopyxis microcysteis TaxID=2484145 RepID=UPI00144594D9|nr:hypothetical protein [Sphingopyxis microcysteis]